jgi:hypothetical protein
VKNRNIKPQLFLLFSLFLTLVFLLLFKNFLPADKNVLSGKLEKFERINKDYGERELPREIIEKYYGLIGPENMLAVIEGDSYCHIKGHNIGFVIFKQTGDVERSMRICSDKCTSGCLHGVINALFSEQAANKNAREVHTNLSNIKPVIKEVCATAGKTSKKGAAVCPHGIGHALFAMSEYDPGKASDYCLEFEAENEKFDCANGVFMEYFSNKTSGENNGICSENVFPTACYRYKFFYLTRQNDSGIVAEECLGEQDEKVRWGCFNGLGFAFAQKVRKGEVDIKNICSGPLPADRQGCLEGVISVIATYDLREAELICAALDSPDKEMCQAAIKLTLWRMAK